MPTDQDTFARREAAARRRLAALGAALDVPPAEFGADAGATAGAARRTAATAAPAGRSRRSRALAGVGAAAAVTAVAAAVVTVLGDGGPDDRLDSTVVVPTNRPGCGPQTAAPDGTIVGGTLEDGTPWSVRSEENDGWQSTFAAVDGADVGGYGLDESSWALAINEGVLPVNVAVTPEATLVWGMVPAETARVEVTDTAGAGDPPRRPEDASRTVVACPVAVPAERDAVRTFGVVLPAGTVPDLVAAVAGPDGGTVADGDLEQLLRDSPTGGGTQMLAHQELLPLGGAALPGPQPPTMVEVDAETGAVVWSLRAGQAGDHLLLSMDGPGDHDVGVEGTPEQLLGPDANWHVDRVDGGLLVWGPVVPEARFVDVTTADGTVHPGEARPTLTGVPVRAFATLLPAGQGPVAIEARSGGAGGAGPVVQRAVGLPEALAPLLAGDPEVPNVGVLVERVG